MRIIAKKTLREAWQRHPDAEGPLSAWYARVKNASWDTPNDVRSQFPRARFIQDNRIVFNINHNQFRLIVWIYYPAHEVYIKWFGTHAEYDRINVNEVGL